MLTLPVRWTAAATGQGTLPDAPHFLEEVLIRHTVVFRLHEPADSESAADFLTRARILADIPGVQKFEQLRQVSPKNDYDFGFSMEFADQAAYDAYNVHPDHVEFVAGHWVPRVADFLEIDYTAL